MSGIAGVRLGRGWRGLRLRRGIGDGPQRIDHARAHLVVLKRVERPLRLFGRQHISVSRGCGVLDGSLGASLEASPL